MEVEGCCRSFCDGCPWAEAQLEKMRQESEEKTPRTAASQKDAS